MQALSNVMGDQGRCVKMMYQFTNGPWGRFFPPWSRFAPITGRNQVRIRRGGGGPPDGEVGYRPPRRHRVRPRRHLGHAPGAAYRIPVWHCRPAIIISGGIAE